MMGGGVSCTVFPHAIILVVLGFYYEDFSLFSLHVSDGCWPADLICWGVLVLDYLWFTVMAVCWSCFDLGLSLLVLVSTKY